MVEKKLHEQRSVWLQPKHRQGDRDFLSFFHINWSFLQVFCCIAVLSILMKMQTPDEKSRGFKWIPWWNRLLNGKMEISSPWVDPWMELR